MREAVSTKIEINDEQYANVEGFVHYHIDTRFGEDADGNRGESRTIIDDVLDISIYDDEGNDLTVPQNIIDRAGDALVTKFLEN